MGFILKIIVNAIAFLGIAYIVPGIVIADVYTAIIAAIVLAVLNILVKPVLFILTLPITILSLGLFTFVLNAIMFGLAAYFVPGFSVSGFLPALIGSLILSVINGVLHK